MILQFDASGNVVGSYKTIMEACRESGVNDSSIRKVLKGDRNSAGGFFWRGTEEKENSNYSENLIENEVPIEASAKSELDSHLKERGIAKKDVVSVKHWQTMKGESRFSVVTKPEAASLLDFKKTFFEEMKEYIPQVVDPVYDFKVGDPVAYEISLPDFHYGKITNISQDKANRIFLDTVKELHRKAAGLNIERFILPIGNDGLNSEGYSKATTKGTPQHDAEEWQQTFRGYWKLLVMAIDYLSAFAPVDVIVVQGNHDFERMFYIGEVIESWYKDSTVVTVDNSYDSRKYYVYGKNMLMFTHGDKEKPADMPLLMATEEPVLFAKCKYREVHCGHQHREIVNTYTGGIKVRFLPSICSNDSWHKTMGYGAMREAQAYIWNKNKGCEGYLQANLD
jgi:hypothetical protein